MNFKNLNEAFENKFSVSRSLLREEQEQEKSRQLSKKRFLESIDRTLTEKHWKFTIPGTFRNAIFDAGDEEDYEGVRQALVSICEYVVDNIKESEFDADEQEEIAEEFADFIEELEYMDFEDEDEANYYLNDLYDLLDNTDIFLGLRESLREAAEDEDLEDEDLAETYRLAIIDWLYDHDQARRDIEAHTGVSIEHLSLPGLKAVISEHDQLARDFEAYFNDSLDESLNEEKLTEDEPSNYYDLLNSLDTPPDDAKLIKYFEDAISGKIEIDSFGHSPEWFADHFYSTAEYISENIYDEDVQENFNHYFTMAEEEIQILNKYGFGSQATWLEELLSEATIEMQEDDFNESLNESQNQYDEKIFDIWWACVDAGTHQDYVINDTIENFIEETGKTYFSDDLDLTISNLTNSEKRALLRKMQEAAKDLLGNSLNESINEEKPNANQFEAYVLIQKSGITNMFDVDTIEDVANAILEVYLDRANCLYIYKHYNELMDEYKDQIDVSDSKVAAFMDQYEDIYYDDYDDYDDYDECLNESDGQIDNTIKEKVIKKFNQEIAKSDIDHSIDEDGYGFHITRKDGSKLSYDASTGKMEFTPVKKLGEGKITGGSMPPKDVATIEPLINDFDRIEEANKDILYITWSFGRRLSDNKMTAGVDISTYRRKSEESLDMYLEAMENAIQKNGFKFDDSLGYDSEHWRKHAFGNGYHTQIIEDVEEVVEESFGYKPSFDEWYFQETGVNTSDLTDEQYDELWADENLMNHYRKFCGSLDESLNEEYEEVDISDYKYVGNVDGFSTYRKVITDENGKMRGIWAAQDQDEKEPPFRITYDQALGYEPIKDTHGIKRLSRDLGRLLLPQDESLKEEYEEDDVLTLYHGTNKELSNIDFLSSKELGLHAGTLEQAQNKGKIIYQIDVDKNTPTLNLHDDLTSGYFSSPEFLILLKNNNIIGDMDFENLYQTLRLYSGEDGENKYKGYSEVYRNFLLNKGFKLIKYPNKAEGSGYSYIILDDSIIKSIKNIDEKSESSESLNESLPKEIKKDIDRIVKTHGAHNIPKWQIQSIAQDNPNYSKEIWRYVSDLEYPDNGINEQLESGYYPSEWDTDFEDELEDLGIEPQRGVFVGYQYRVPNRRLASKMVKLAKEFGYDDSWVEGNTLYLKWSRPEKEYHKSPYDECLTEDTIKQNGKWVNKGKEGTHGTFKTKKEADAQRKAMFANNFKG